MNLRELDLSGFGTMLQNHDKPLSIIQFKDNNDLKMISQKMTEYVYMKFEQNPNEEVTPESIMKYLSEYQKEESSKPYFGMLEKYSNMLSKAYKDSLSVLKNEVYTDVHNLSKAIESYTKENLHYLGAENLIEEEVDATDFEEFDWDDATGDTSTLLDTLSIDAGYKLPITEYNIRNLSNFLRAVKPQGNKIDLPNDVRLDVIKMVVKQTNKDSDFVENLVNLLINPNECQKFLYSHFADYEKKNPFMMCKLFKDTLSTHAPIFHLMEGMRFNLSDETQSVFKDNIKNLILMCDIMKYALVCERKFFQNSLVLDKKTVNKDTYTTFQDKEGTPLDIRNYLRANYIVKKRKLPDTGIMMQTLLNSKERTAKEIKLLDIDITARKREFKHKATTMAFERATQEYLKNTHNDRIPNTIGKENFIHNKIAMANSIMASLHDKDGNIEDSLYKFVIQCWYENTSVEKLYHEYQKESIISMENSSNGNVDIDTLEACVCSKMFTKFLITSFCQ